MGLHENYASKVKHCLMETLLSVIHKCTVNIGEILLLFFAKNCNGILATDQQPNTGI